MKSKGQSKIVPSWYEGVSEQQVYLCLKGKGGRVGTVGSVVNLSEAKQGLPWLVGGWETCQNTLPAGRSYLGSNPAGDYCGTDGVSPVPHRRYPHPGWGRQKGPSSRVCTFSPCPWGSPPERRVPKESPSKTCTWFRSLSGATAPVKSTAHDDGSVTEGRYSDGGPQR